MSGFANMQRRITFLIEAVNRTDPAFKEADRNLLMQEEYRAGEIQRIQKETRAIRYLRAAYQYKYGVIFDGLTIMRRVGAIGTTLLNMWWSQNIAQMRVASSTGDVKDAQIRLGEAMEMFGEDSVQYLDALDDLEDAQEDLKKATDSARKGVVAQAMTGVGVIAQLGLVAIEVSRLASEYEGVGAAITSIGSAAIAVIPLIGMLGGALYGLTLPEEERERQIREMERQLAITDWGVTEEQLEGDLKGSLLDFYRKGFGLDEDYVYQGPLTDEEAAERFGRDRVNVREGIIPLDVRGGKLREDYGETGIIDYSRTIPSTEINFNIDTVKDEADVEMIARKVERAIHRREREDF